MIRGLFLTMISALALLSAGCGSRDHAPSAPEQEDMVLGQELPEDFKTFFERFHEDSVFQMEHIAFPLEGFPSGLTAENYDPQFRWQPDDWVMHKPFNNENDEYQRKFEVITPTMVIEYILSRKASFGMERRFARMGEEWYLIYYSALNKVKEKESGL